VLATDPARSLVAIQNQPGSIAIFDSSMHQVGGFTVPGNVVYAGFDKQGKRLLVLTGAQVVFVEDVP